MADHGTRNKGMRCRGEIQRRKGGKHEEKKEKCNAAKLRRKRT
jgi:hypothetical protein